MGRNVLQSSLFNTKPRTVDLTGGCSKLCHLNTWPKQMSQCKQALQSTLSGKRLGFQEIKGFQTYRYFVRREHVEIAPLDSRHGKSSNYDVENVVRNPVPQCYVAS
jgi:hypothetical protein